jgi:GDP/UDP-N,N'-diacetylbacillosamine 2-epimerase (hydrolysing)
MANILVITTTRADFGLLKNLIKSLKKNKFNCKVLASGTHFSKYYGYTSNEIKSENIKIDFKLKQEIITKNSIGISKIISQFIKQVTKILNKSNPDLVVLLGDRYEIFGAAVAAHISRIPIAHIHGGELTNGVIDDAFRHSITKMSQLHFVSNKIYRKRVIQLGENPETVHTVGGMGVESIKNTKLLSQKKIEKKLKIKFLKKNLLINFHPETLRKGEAKYQVKELINALKTLKNTCLIFTMPGAEVENKLIVGEIRKFVKNNNNSYYFRSLGQQNFFSILKIVDAMVGNSSSGLLEMPTFKKATLNLGDRQSGRLKSESVLDTNIKKKDIIKSINRIYSKKFKIKIKNSFNPYGNGGASEKIIKVLKENKRKNFIIKKFYDIKF